MRTYHNYIDSFIEEYQRVKCTNYRNIATRGFSAHYVWLFGRYNNSRYRIPNERHFDGFFSHGMEKHIVYMHNNPLRKRIRHLFLFGTNTDLMFGLGNKDTPVIRSVCYYICTGKIELFDYYKSYDKFWKKYIFK